MIMEQVFCSVGDMRCKWYGVSSVVGRYYGRAEEGSIQQVKSYVGQILIHLFIKLLIYVKGSGHR